MKLFPSKIEVNALAVLVAFVIGLCLGLLIQVIDSNSLEVYIGLNKSDQIALASAVIALSAFGATAYSSYLARKHNRISVFPKLDYAVVFSNSVDRIGLFLVNNGLGPAVIEKWELLVDDMPYRAHGIERFEQLTTFLKLDDTVNYGYFKPGTMFQVGEAIELFAVSTEPYSFGRNDQIRNALQRLKITITYRSIYQELKREKVIFNGSKYFQKNFGEEG
ncbi:MAG: hypothetical protein QUV19_03615 [Alteromonas macleodii]|uniref:hypothetical protein n=1 Tax=Alteromonas TaxID=226 RepID=UPI0012DDC8D1|nr:hypothetical protein [Alteromonas macleodii]MDM7961201.1 hypothetical protein [Alteromonas macleodii]MDM8169654.1 hypothetical protein [Alteromonas macleodii]